MTSPPTPDELSRALIASGEPIPWLLPLMGSVGDLLADVSLLVEAQPEYDVAELLVALSHGIMEMDRTGAGTAADAPQQLLPATAAVMAILASYAKTLQDEEDAPHD